MEDASLIFLTYCNIPKACVLIAQTLQCACKKQYANNNNNMPRHASTDPARANQTRLPALGLLPLGFG
jgi:hypothetical protein